tara:strand:+ start:882 stop:2783 length:1902 start_codon:yes stop_codon:yes gene_type:complete
MKNKLSLKYSYKSFLFLAFFMLLSCTGRTERPSLEVSIDLVEVIDDRVKVNIVLNNYRPKTTTFFMPEIIPGTYSDFDYGKYISKLKAFDKNENNLVVKRLNDNTWQIPDINKLHKITYWADDILNREDQKETFYGRDQMLGTFGTNFEKGDNFLLNMQAIVGYFEMDKNIPYTLKIKYPKDLYASTSMKEIETLEKEGCKTAFYYADRYFTVVDNPILICKKPSINFKVNDLEIQLAVYSNSKEITPKALKGTIEKLIGLQENYLSKLKTTDRYTIILYEVPKNIHSDFGALEHNTGTQAVFSSELSIAYLKERVFNVIAHEFFHVLTPLQLHSEYIHDFNYNTSGKMSKHLWLYEGVTEYFSMLFQVNKGVISEEEFYTKIMNKIHASKMFNTKISLTKTSQNILEEPYLSEYNNFYHKGALIAMALDIKLREISQGRSGILHLIKQLSDTYGATKPFKDATFIAEITALTDLSIGNFFEKYVEGTEPIPYGDILNKIGLQLESKDVETYHFSHKTNNSLGVYLKRNSEEQWQLGGFFPLNDWQYKMGLQEGDILVSVNKVLFNTETLFTIIRDSFAWKHGDKVSIVIKREDKELTKVSKVFSPKVNETFITVNPDASKKAKELRGRWLFD